jgi:LacI family transcriptional regulator
MMSIKDIAKLAGVSPSTVSRVVNEKNYVKPEIRARVLALVKETGYVPDAAARSMVLKRTFTVGIVIPDTFNMFQRQLFSTIERFLEGFGYRTLFFFVKWEPESESKCLRRLKAEKLDGIIMIHEVSDPDFYGYLAQGSVPVVLCTFARDGFGFPSVHVDEELATRAAMNHLIDLGHRSIGLISGKHFSFGSQRVAGYRAALSSANIPIEEARIILVPSYSPEDGRAGMRELLSRNKRLTAVFAATDELAIGAARALYEVGLAVPGDISIVGFDDIDISAYLSPGLTTVRQPIVEMGKKTAELMSGLIAGETEEMGSIIFNHQLIVRESSRDLKAGAARSVVS